MPLNGFEFVEILFYHVQHGSYFHTTLHAVHRHSIERYLIGAIGDWEDKYKRDHFMSEEWATDYDDEGGAEQQVG